MRGRGGRDLFRPSTEIEQVLDRMPSNSPVEKRNRAVIAFTLLTGARDGALRHFG